MPTRSRSLHRRRLSRPVLYYRNPMGLADTSPVPKKDPEARDSARSLAEGALSRLKNWDIPAAQIDRLRNGGQPTRTLSLASPASGVVLEKRAIQGMRFMPGEALFQLADLSNV
ncbi:MAG: efflux RND transporter periplasmic adaptor subunit [Rhodospirillaceae bacterium]|nr:efflux RND transporter periplasmic adaptor subunit [Rhodospirillales bacterium]